MWVDNLWKYDTLILSTVLFSNQSETSLWVVLTHMTWPYNFSNMRYVTSNYVTSCTPSNKPFKYWKYVCRPTSQKFSIIHYNLDLTFKTTMFTAPLPFIHLILECVAIYDITKVDVNILYFSSKNRGRELVISMATSRNTNSARQHDQSKSVEVLVWSLLFWKWPCGTKC